MYFPNIIFKLVRSHLPPHQAVFRCSPQLSKIDIKDYLSKLYDLEITNVRTINYLGKIRRNRNQRPEKRADYKKAIITMTQDFVFPPVPDPKIDGALEIMQGASPGKSSGKLLKEKITEYNKRRGFVPKDIIKSK